PDRLERKPPGQSADDRRLRGLLPAAGLPHCPPRPPARRLENPQPPAPQSPRRLRHLRTTPVNSPQPVTKPHLAAYTQPLDPLRRACPVRAALDVIRGRWKPSILFV